MEIRCGDDLTAAQDAQETRACDLIAAAEELSLREPAAVAVSAPHADLLPAIASLRARVSHHQSAAQRLGSQLSLRHLRTIPLHAFYTTRKRVSDAVSSFWKKVTGG